MKKTVETRTILANGTCVEYELERKSVKRLNLRVRRDGSLYLSVPKRTPISEIEEFLFSHLDWIAAARQRTVARSGAPLCLEHGAEVFILGAPRTLLITRGTAHWQLRDTELELSLREPNDATAVKRLFLRFLKEEGLAYLTARTKEIYAEFPPRQAAFPTISVRLMKSRWGSCTAAKNQLCFNTRLLFLPPSLVDYVIYHELCHFWHQDHSPAFHACLSSHLPDQKQRRTALKNYPVPKLET